MAMTPASLPDSVKKSRGRGAPDVDRALAQARGERVAGVGEAKDGAVVEHRLAGQRAGREFGGITFGVRGKRPGGRFALGAADVAADASIAVDVDGYVSA